MLLMPTPIIKQLKVFPSLEIAQIIYKKRAVKHTLKGFNLLE